MSPSTTTTTTTNNNTNTNDVDKDNGHIELIIGPMFSGKSTELHRRIKRHKIAGRTILLVKYKDDTRYAKVAGANANVTHDHEQLPAYAAKDLDNVNNVAHNYDVIGIDEAQFFGDIAKFCEYWANKGKVIIAAGLDGTYQRMAFNEILSLVPLAETVDKLSAVCAMCAKDAAFTLRTTLENADSVELIGGAERYKAACRKCYLEAMDEQAKKQHEASAEETTFLNSNNKPASSSVSAKKKKSNSSGGVSPSSVKRVRNALAEQLESLALHTPVNSTKQQRMNATPVTVTSSSAYTADIADDTFTFATPSGAVGDVLLDKLGFATGKLSEQMKKSKNTETKKSRGFGGPGRSPLTDFMNTSRSPITSLR